MGIIVKQNKKGLYSLTSSVSDKSYHPNDKWVSENEAKAILIYDLFRTFLKKSIEIEMDFPVDWSVNDKFVDGEHKFLKWYGEVLRSDISTHKQLTDKMRIIKNKLDLDFGI